MSVPRPAAPRPSPALVWAVYLALALVLFNVVIRCLDFGVLYEALRASQGGLRVAGPRDLLQLPFSLPLLFGEELLVSVALAAAAWLALRAPWGRRLVAPVFSAYLLLLCLDQMAFKEYLSHVSFEHYRVSHDLVRIRTSIAALADVPFFLLLCGAALLAVPVFSGRPPALAARVAARVAARPVLTALLVAACAGVTYGLVGVAPQAGFERSLLVEAALSLVPDEPDDDLGEESPDWLPTSLLHGAAAPAEDFSAVRQAAAARGRPLNLVYFVAESAPLGETSLAADALFDTTPFLKELAGAGLLFDTFYANYPGSTRGNLATATGLFPHVTGPSSLKRLAAIPVRTLSDVLHDNGYRTALYASTDTWYDDTDRFWRRHSFDRYFDSNSLTLEEKGALMSSAWGVPEEVAIDRALEWMAARTGDDRPFFLQYIATYPHHPYDLPKGHEDIVRMDWGGPGVGKRHRDFRASLFYSDQALERLYRGLERLALLDDTLLVVTPDHGEGLGDRHPARGHHHHIWEEQTHIFALFSNPGLTPRPVRSGRRGSQVDFLPTTLELLGLPDTAPGHGQSLVGAGYVERPIFLRGLSQHGLVDGNLKWMRSLRDKRDHLYDLAADPTEQADIAGAHPEKLRDYRELHRRWMAAVARLYRRLRERMPRATAWDDALRDLRRKAAFGERESQVAQAFVCRRADRHGARPPEGTPVFQAGEPLSLKLVWKRPGSHRALVYLYGPDGRIVRPQAEEFHGAALFFPDAAGWSAHTLLFGRTVSPGPYRVRVVSEYVEREVGFEIVPAAR